MKWKQLPIDPMLSQFLTKEGSLWVKHFKSNTGLTVLLSADPTPKGALKHMSISRPEGYPGWDEIVQAKEYFFGPNMDTMMVIPKRSDYVNLSKNCFHVWETPTEWNIR